MDILEIIYLIIGSLLSLFGIATTIYPHKIDKWLKTNSIQSNEFLFYAGYILGLTGLIILFKVLIG